MRKLIAIVLLVVVGTVALWVMFVRPPSSKIDVEFVSSEPINKINGKEVMLVKLDISNRAKIPFEFGPDAEIHAMVGGRWIEAGRGFGELLTVEVVKLRKWLILPGGAVACRLKFKYRCRYDPSAWRKKLYLQLWGLGPKVKQAVFVTPWLNKWLVPQSHYSELKEITVEVEIPQHPMQPVSSSVPL